MRKKTLKLILLLTLFLLISVFPFVSTPEPTVNKIEPTPQVLGEKIQSATVTKIIDGDTIEVLIGNSREKVRIIGINTPETVDPRREVECYGKEASQRAKDLLTSQTVILESDPTQSDRDRYGRILRYVKLPENVDFGLKMIKEGFAYEYTYQDEYKNQFVYKLAQKEAEAKKVGLWGEMCSQNTADK